MGYFSDQYEHIVHRLATETEQGLRKAQVGGIYAIASHFTVSSAPALVVMPTGTGKTAVLMLTPFFRQSNRALVITPSKLVRNQIAEELRSLAVLKRIGVFADDVPGPTVQELKNRVATDADWEALRSYDVVVATPNGISPDYEAIPKPPQDLFDILLVDEAHHSPARTWRTILDCFPDAQKILFTATPYRQDSREIKGKIIFNYPIRAAYEDKVFGKVRFCPVEPKGGESHDIAIARATQKVFDDDKKAGLEHRVMVRTSQIKRADELVEVYKANSTLRLQSISSNHSYATVTKAIDKLRAGELDGIICVDMMSEGFDFPSLKIAAVHAPHRSLAVTLQFIGRFARTNAPNIGEAKFLAVPQEIKGDVQVLYEENAVWQDIILDLQHGRIQEEEELREAIETFADPVVSDLSFDDLSLYSLRPYSHVKVYRVESAALDITTSLSLPRPFQVALQQVSTELSAVVIIANETEQPKWTDLPAFNRSEFDLFVIYFDAKERLLFINASRKTESLYDHIAGQLTQGAHKILPLYAINRVLHGMQQPEFFNVGMKNRVAHSNAESYRIISGPRAERAVNRSDGRLYHCGHVFGKGLFKDESTTIGFSSASKIWSNQNLQIPQLIAWCRELARRFAIEGPLPKLAGLDNLPVGEKLTEFPNGLILARWPDEIYQRHIDLRFTTADGTVILKPLSEVDLTIDRPACNATQIVFQLVADGLAFPILFRLDRAAFFEVHDDKVSVPTVIRKGTDEGLLAYLNNNPVTFFTADYSLIRGDEVIRFSNADLQPLSLDAIRVIDWSTRGADITMEFATKKGKKKGAAKLSIHECLWEDLNIDDHLAVLYDHRVGEAADFIALSEKDGRILISLYHCKGSGADKPGDRVEDLYELCGQGVKSLIWIDNEPDLLEHIRSRAATGSQFVRGNFKAVKAAVERGTKIGFAYGVWLVQPGVTKKGLSKKVGELLASTRDYLVRSGVRDFGVLGSE